jgi:hypothetical protein
VARLQRRERALRKPASIESLNLVVIKRRQGEIDLLELHPLVRQFIHSSFPANERRSYIADIVRAYKKFIGVHKSQLSVRPALSILEYWTQNAELDIIAGSFEDAFLTLAEASSAFISSAYPREFARATRLLLASANWTSEYAKYRGFEVVFRAHIRILSYLGTQ